MRGDNYLGTRITAKDYSDRIDSLYNGSMSLMEAYVDSETSIMVRCNTCGCEKLRHPRSLSTGNLRCTTCTPIKNSKSMTSTQVRELIYSLVCEEYTMLGDYVNNETKISLRHNSEYCEFHEYKVSLDNFRGLGRRCPICSTARGAKKSTDRGITKFKKYFKTVTDYELLEPVRRQKDKILFNCTLCDHPPFMMTPDKFRHGQRCPLCSSSRGEQRVYSFLNSHNISHVYQHVFEDCVYTQPLRFDFGLQDAKGNVVAIVEFDGVQHVKIVEIYGGAEGLRSLQERDAIKNNYCTTHSIPLLRISQEDEDNIEVLLTEFIKEVYKT